MNKWKIFMAVLMVIALLATFMVSCSSDEEEFDLKISVDPADTGTTTPAVGTHAYTEGDVITITATPATGYEFDSWTGDVADTSAASTTVTMDANQTVTANFVEAVVTYTLTIAADPNSGGTTDPAKGTYDYEEGTVVDITATAEDRYWFDSWTGDVADTSAATTTVTMDADQTVTANFEAQYVVTMTISDIDDLTGGEALLRECLGDTVYDGGLITQGGFMTLVAAMPMAQGMITDEMIDCVEAGIVALMAPTLDSPIEDLAAYPGGRALLDSCLTANLAGLFLQMKPEFSINEAVASPEAQGMVTQAMADCVEAGLAALVQAQLDIEGL